MKLIWDEKAKSELKQVARYIRKSFGLNQEKKYQQIIRNAANMLLTQPYMGALDPQLSDRTKSYRSVIVNKLNKMVYYVENDVVTIVAFWDCRRDSDQQSQHLQ